MICQMELSISSNSCNKSSTTYQLPTMKELEHLKEIEHAKTWRPLFLIKLQY